MADPVRPVLLQDPQARQKWTNADGTPTPYFHRYNHSVFMRLGGYEDSVWRSLGIGYTGLTQINQVSQRVDGVEAATAAVQGAVAGLRGDPRLDDAVSALKLATVALVQVQARANGESDRRIDDIGRLVASLGARTTKAQQAIQAQVDQTQADTTQGQKLQVAFSQRIGADQVTLRDDVDEIDANLETRAKASLSGTAPINYNSTSGAIGVTLDPDGTLAANSDTVIASQKAIKTYVGATAQPLDSDLTAIAGLTASNDDFLQRKSGAWANRTVAQVKTDLGLAKAPMTASVAAFALTSLTAHDLCYIDLPVGTWSVSGNVSFAPSGGTTPTILRAYITTVSATQPATPNAGAIQQISSTGFPADNGQSLVAGVAVFTVAAGTTRVYLGTRTAFTGPTMAADGYMNATSVT